MQDVEKYLDSEDGLDLTPYTPFVQMIGEGIIKFQDFEKYSLYKLVQIRKIYALGVHIKNKLTAKQLEEK